MILPDRRDRGFAARHFGVMVSSVTRPIWDTTTLAMLEPLRAHALAARRVLEIGTGPYALLSIVIRRQNPSTYLLATDLRVETLRLARRTAADNGARIDFACARTLRGIGGRFELVFMNPPYVPTDRLLAEGVGIGTDAWLAGHGGPTGDEQVRELLDEVPERLSRSGCCIVGVNNFHVPDARVVGAIWAAGLTLRRRWYPALPAAGERATSQVYVVTR